MPTQVWYKAYPGLTAVDLERNTRRPAGPRGGVAERDGRPRPGWRCCDARRPSTIATSRAWCASATSTCTRRRYVLAARARMRRRRGRGCVGAGHQRASSAQPPPPTALQVAFTRGGPRGARRAAGGARRLLAGVPRRDDRAEPRAAGWATSAPMRPSAVGVGRRRRRAARARDVLCRARDGSTPRRGRDRRRGVERRVRRAAPARAPVDLDGVEPFGFVDGISQPWIDWAQARDPATRALDYSNVVGARRVPARLPQRVRQVHRSAAGRRRRRRARRCPRPRTTPDKKDVGRNGTYLVMRQLGQDVRGFWQFVAPASGGDAGRGRIAWRRPWSAARRRAIRWCRSAPSPFPASDRSPTRFGRTSSPSTAIRAAWRVRSARTSAARTRATPTIPAARPA